METNNKSRSECFSCKLISVGCLVGIGTYLFKLGSNNKPKIAYQLIGGVLLGLGIGESFDVSPFRNRTEK